MRFGRVARDPTGLIGRSPSAQFNGRVFGGATFPIGAGGTFTAPETGSLELAVNDNQGHYYDNSGGYAVRITATQP